MNAFVFIRVHSWLYIRTSIQITTESTEMHGENRVPALRAGGRFGRSVLLCGETLFFLGQESYGSRLSPG